MTAIAGFISRDNSGQAVLPDLLDKMEHRGDRRQQLFYGEHAAIGFASDEPALEKDFRHVQISQDEKQILICDGDISQLSNGSKISLLESYQKHGIEFTKTLTVPFALLMIEKNENGTTFFAARDWLGSKPLYYAEKDGCMYLSSEIKSLVSLNETVHAFPPGHYYQPEKGFIRFDQIKSPAEKIDALKSNQSLVSSVIREKLRTAVNRSIEGDKRIGLMLSGGLDSSLVAALVQEMDDQPRKSFCVGSAGSSDLPAAQEAAAALGTEHYEYVYSVEEMMEAIPRVIYYLESFEPTLVRSAVPNYFAFRMAAGHCDIVLSGEGADELFSGYDYLKEIDDPIELDKELIRVINNLHHIGLQRGDRMSAANGIEVRTPFLDRELMEYALRIPTEWKMLQTPQGIIEKWILREAFDGKTRLPKDILWRDKEEFSEGSGAKDVISDLMDGKISHTDYLRKTEEIMETDEILIRSKEELYYYQIFKSYYNAPALAQQVGRWAAV